MKHEYMSLRFEFEDLSEMNRLAADDWRVISVMPTGTSGLYEALFERRIPFDTGARSVTGVTEVLAELRKR